MEKVFLLCVAPLCRDFNGIMLTVLTNPRKERREFPTLKAGMCKLDAGLECESAQLGSREFGERERRRNGGRIGAIYTTPDQHRFYPINRS